MGLQPETGLDVVQGTGISMTIPVQTCLLILVQV